MNNVVYILGAGFSAPLGIPVMSAFLTRSKDIYSSSPEKYQHFFNIFKSIDALAKVKNYLTSDLFNIEEVLSILEMQAYVSGSAFDVVFAQYIADVVKACTPDYPSYIRPSHSRFEEGLFSSYVDFTGIYSDFLASAIGLQFEDNGIENKLICTRCNDRRSQYGFISLNYDMVLEKFLDHLNSEYQCPIPFAVCPVDDQRNVYGNENGIALAKLHGSIEPLTIVPPTWNKTRREDIGKAWRVAHSLISQANYIRIIGYSLPKTDVYMKYLLTTGIINSLNIKGIDVICLDPDKTVEKRYREMISFHDFRFFNADICEYMKISTVGNIFQKEGKPRAYSFPTLEQRHSIFINKHMKQIQG